MTNDKTDTHNTLNDTAINYLKWTSDNDINEIRRLFSEHTTRDIAGFMLADGWTFKRGQIVIEAIDNAREHYLG